MEPDKDLRADVEDVLVDEVLRGVRSEWSRNQHVYVNDMITLITTRLASDVYESIKDENTVKEFFSAIFYSMANEAPTATKRKLTKRLIDRQTTMLANEIWKMWKEDNKGEN